MKKLPIKKIAVLAALSFTFCTAAISQTVFQAKAFDIKLNGTSNIHDWEMKANSGSSEAVFNINDNGKITSITKLNFVLPATNLKSKHSGMDKNTYKALKTDKNPNISFVGTSAHITSTSGDTYQITCKGNLTIAGTTKLTDLVATAKYNPADKSLTVTGVKRMKMTEYNVQPPTALLGTIKTGDDISIAYNLKFIK